MLEPGASLIGTDPEGLRDLPPAAEARIYLIAARSYAAFCWRGMFAMREPLNIAAARWCGVRPLGP